MCPGFTYTEFHDVESMKGFNREWFPEEAWMSAEEVISLSLSNFADGGVIYIPGEYNQKIVNEHFANNSRL